MWKLKWLNLCYTNFIISSIEDHVRARQRIAKIHANNNNDNNTALNVTDKKPLTLPKRGKKKIWSDVALNVCHEIMYVMIL